MSTEHRRCPEWTESAGRVVVCTKPKGHEGQHAGLNHLRKDVVWLSVTLPPPAQEDT